MVTKEQNEYWDFLEPQNKTNMLANWYCNKFVWDKYRKACLKEAKEIELYCGKENLEKYKEQIEAYLYENKPIEFTN